MSEQIPTTEILDLDTIGEEHPEYLELATELNASSKRFIKRAKGIADKQRVSLDVIIRFALKKSKED